MDAPDRSSSPRSRQQQGPRPPRLAVSKDSHKVKKPPIAPQQRHHQPQQQQARAPVIIYDASPKVIHTKPRDFMALVQRLTGPSAPPQLLPSPTAALSPAARLAAIVEVRPPAAAGPLRPRRRRLRAARLRHLRGGARPAVAAGDPLAGGAPAARVHGALLADAVRPEHPLLARRPQPLPPQFAPTPRSHLLATPNMPSPATFSVLQFFSNFPDM